MTDLPVTHLRSVLWPLGVSVILHAAFLFYDWRIGGKQVTPKINSALEAKLVGAPFAVEKKDAVLDSTSHPVREEVPAKQAISERERADPKTVVPQPEEVLPTPVKNPSAERGGARADDEGGRAVFDGSISGVGQGPASRVEIDVDLYFGIERQFSGRARNIYIASDNQYGLTVEGMSESPDLPTGQSWRLDVSGRIRDNGLNPELYSGEGGLSRRFFGYADKDNATPFGGRTPDGLLDGQSLLFQFMHMRANKIDKLAVATPTSYVFFDGVRQGEAWIDVPGLGSIKTQKYLFATAKSTETIEVWLLPEQRNLPLRIRRVFPDGDVIEQVVTGLRVEQ